MQSKPFSKLPRRSFLKLIALGGAATVGFPSLVRAQTLGLGDATAANARITLGFIGLGGQGNGLLRSFLGQSDARVVALCDVDAQRLAKAGKDADATYQGTATTTAYTDYRELLAHPGLDAVVVATPDHWHALIVVHAARAGKHVYCEKPLASSIPEGRAMVDAVRRAGVVGMMGSQQRSAGEFQRVVELARNGYLGEIQSVTVGLPSGPAPRPVADADLQNWQTPPEHLDYDRWLGPAAWHDYRPERVHYQWRWLYAFGGGQLADWIGHHYDIAALATGVSHLQPVALDDIRGTFAPSGAFFDTATSYAFRSRYANGIVLDVASSHPGGLRVEGSEGWVYANRGVLEHSSGALRRLIMPAQGFTFAGAGRSHAENFLHSIRHRSPSRAPLAEGHSVATVAHLANAALRAGVPALRWDPATETLLDAPAVEPFLRRPYRAPYVLPV